MGSSISSDATAHPERRYCPSPPPPIRRRLRERNGGRPSHLLLLGAPILQSSAIFRSDCAPASFPGYAFSSLPSSVWSAGQRNQPSHITVLARPVCPFVCFSDVYEYVGILECEPASPYTYSSPTHMFPDERTPIGNICGAWSGSLSRLERCTRRVRVVLLRPSGAVNAGVFVAQGQPGVSG